jgi:hypothetical protein
VINYGSANESQTDDEIEWDEMGGRVQPVAGDTIESLKKVLEGLEELELEYETRIVVTSRH